MDASEPGWFGVEPLPGDEDHESFKAYEAQQDAFWSAVGLGQVPVCDGLPDLTASRTDAGLLEAARQADRAEAAAVGTKLRAVSNFVLRRAATPRVGYDEAAMEHSAQAELGLQFGISPSEAASVVQLAMTLTRRLPKTFAKLETGAIGKRKVDAIAEESINLNVAQCARLEDAVLPGAETRSPRSLRDKVRSEVEKLDAEAVHKRRQSATADRTLWVKDEHDGMATLCLYLPAPQAHATYDAINARINAHRTDPGDDRKIGARRVDHALDILGAALGIDLHAVTDTETGDETAVLTAEQIARLDRGANSYVPSEAMKNAIRARDKHCRFPGCRRPAIHCDLDHTIAFKVGGRTVFINLGCICRFHHKIKHMPGWHVTQDTEGTFTWTNPTGEIFTVRPPPANGEESPEFRSPEQALETPPF